MNKPIAEGEGWHAKSRLGSCQQLNPASRGLILSPAPFALHHAGPAIPFPIGVLLQTLDRLQLGPSCRWVVALLGAALLDQGADLGG